MGNIEKVYEAIGEIKKVIVGKDDCIKKVMMAILSEGHILIEDIPGVGKTTLALAFSKVLRLDYNRIQLTPDVLPSDIIGFSMYKKASDEFVYQAGPIMCNLFLADEINRTSPKTQSALLEVMEEGSVTVDGVTKEVPKPFTVIATQNPAGSAGTQRLPESQLDRFAICISMGYPDKRAEMSIAKGERGSNNISILNPVLNVTDVAKMQKEADSIFVHDAVLEYIANLVSATRNHSMIDLGVSPRGTIMLTKMAKASAYFLGRKFVIPDDVIGVFKDVVAHRIHLNAQARMLNTSTELILEEIIRQVENPALASAR